MSSAAIEPVRVALLGCGAVARLYYTPALRSLQAASRIQVTAVLDPGRENAALVQEHFPAAAAVQEMAELLRCEFDLGIVASPHSLHAQQTIQLLERGKSVLCEKPLATSAADAQSMADAAAVAPGIMAIGMVRRFFPAAQTIRRMLALQVLGELESFHIAEGDASFRWPVASPGYFKKREAHGGVLMDIGVHALDLMLWWFGEPLEVTYQDDAMGGIEANCRLRCVYAGGLAGEVRLSRDCALPNRYTIRGAKGWISWQVNDADKLEFGFHDTRYAFEAGLRRVLDRSPHPSLGEPAFVFEQSFMDQICNVLEAMQGREALRVGPADMVTGLRLIEHCYANRSLMPMLWLGESEVQRAEAARAQSE